jgi:phosphoribosylformylglycinamidine cyclo-ligase
VRDLAQPLGSGGTAGSRTLGDALLEPTRIYVKAMLAAMRDVDVKGMAHITGGGLLENVHRMFPDALAARIERARWPRPAIFDWLQRAGNVADAEMHRVFNCGIGMVVVVAAAEAERTTALLAQAGETVFSIGTVVPRAAGRARHSGRLGRRRIGKSRHGHSPRYRPGFRPRIEPGCAAGR